MNSTCLGLSPVKAEGLQCPASREPSTSASLHHINMTLAFPPFMNAYVLHRPQISPPVNALTLCFKLLALQLYYLGLFSHLDYEEFAGSRQWI